MLILKKALRGWKNYFLIFIGSVITAAAINIFLVPYKIAPGGVTGIATVIYHLSGSKFPVGTIMLALNIPLFIGGVRFIGRSFIFRTLFGTIVLSVIIDGTELFTRNFVQNHLQKFENWAAAPDLLLYSIFGGFLMGVGLGLVFKAGATTGGTDLAARIVNHFIPHITMGQILLLVDAGVVVFAAVAFNSFQLALYAIVSLYIASKIIDAILEGVNFAKALFIISDHAQEIAEKILKDVDRGVTALKGTGMYTGKDKQVLLCVVHRAQLPEVKEIVRNADPKAFIILTDIREAFGEGFKTYD